MTRANKPTMLLCLLLTITFVWAQPASAESKDIRRTEQQVVDVFSNDTETTWQVDFGPVLAPDDVLNETFSRTVFQFGANIGLNPTGLASSVVWLDLEIDGNSTQICRITAGRGTGSGPENYAPHQLCVIQPMLTGLHNITVEHHAVVQSTIRLWYLQTTQHVSLEGEQNLTLNISEVDVKTTAFLDFVWVFWAGFAAIVYRLKDPVMRAVAAVPGLSILLLPISGWQFTILFAAQVALVVLTAAPLIEGKARRAL